MAFPGPHAEVFYNEAGEPIGWDNHYYDEPPERDPWEESAADAAAECRAEEAFDWAVDEGADDETCERFSEWANQRDQYKLEIEHSWANFMEWKAKHP